MNHPADLDQQDSEVVLQKPVVIVSLEDDTGMLCVDILELRGYGFGFQEFRRDPEDPHGWRPTGLCQECVLEAEDTALAKAKEAVVWLGNI